MDILLQPVAAVTGLLAAPVAGIHTQHTTALITEASGASFTVIRESPLFTSEAVAAVVEFTRQHHISIPLMVDQGEGQLF
jgi:hypothetical protein